MVEAELSERLGRIEVALATLTAKVDAALQSNTDHETRIRKLEQKFTYSAGAFAVLTVIAHYALKKLAP